MSLFSPDFVPSNDNVVVPVPDRRREPRRRVLLQGKIVYPHNGCTADCVVRDLSSGGARLSAVPEALTSHPFLIVVRQAVAYEARTAWAAPPQAGLQFVARTDLGGEVPRHFKAIQRLWVELMPR